MKYQYSFIAAALLLAGCGGSDSPKSPVELPQYQLSGTLDINTQTLLNAKVCTDLNHNLRCDASEPSIDIQSDQPFSLQATTEKLYSSPLVAEISLNKVEYRLFTVGHNAAQPFVINELTTLLSAMVLNGQSLHEAEQRLVNQLPNYRNNTEVIHPINTNALAPRLDNLSLNMQQLIPLLTDENMVIVLATLGNDLKVKDKHFAYDLFSEQDLNNIIEEIANQQQQRMVLNDTGVKLFYSGNQRQLIEQSSIHYPGQDADFGFDATDRQLFSGNGFKFIKLDQQGGQLDNSASEWSCVQDVRTGQIWEHKNDQPDSVHFYNRTFALKLPNFEPAIADISAADCQQHSDKLCSTQDYVDYLNEKAFCGQTNWRLPTLIELYNLVDFGETKKTEDGKLYAFTHPFFLHQSQGSPYTLGGEVWHSSIKFSLYSSLNDKGVFSYPVIQGVGEDRGQIGFYDIYSASADAELGDSYQLPVRMVSLKDN